MRSRDFVYWLQGYFELLAAREPGIADATPLTSGQAECIRRHLNMVFVHEIDPSFPAEQQNALQAAHDGVSSPSKSELATRPSGVRC